jgi:hypothetical protein
MLCRQRVLRGAVRMIQLASRANQRRRVRVVPLAIGARGRLRALPRRRRARSETLARSLLSLPLPLQRAPPGGRSIRRFPRMTTFAADGEPCSCASSPSSAIAGGQPFLYLSFIRPRRAGGGAGVFYTPGWPASLLRPRPCPFWRDAAATPVHSASATHKDTSSGQLRRAASAALPRGGAPWCSGRGRWQSRPEF